MEQRLERASNYYTVITLMVFGCLFFGTACMQMNAATAFAVEDPVLRAHLGDLDAEAFTVNMPDDILEWVDSTLVGGAFEDAQCGNGQCESPQEYPGFGRFGCDDDCGKYEKTSRIKVHFGGIALLVDFGASGGQGKRGRWRRWRRSRMQPVRASSTTSRRFSGMTFQPMGCRRTVMRVALVSMRTGSLRAAAGLTTRSQRQARNLRRPSP